MRLIGVLLIGVIAAAGSLACKDGGVESPTGPGPIPQPNTTVYYTAIGASDAIAVGASVVCVPYSDCPDGRGYVQVATRELKARGFTVNLSNLGFPAHVLSRRLQDLGTQYGRAMTGNTQVLIASVLSLKAGEPKPGWAILDAGINLAECARTEFHQIFPATRMHEIRTHRYRLAGPICSPGDVLSWSACLPELAVGDALAIMDAGAYFVPFSTSFSFPQPAVVMLEGAKVRLLRRAERFEDIVALDEIG